MSSFVEVRNTVKTVCAKRIARKKRNIGTCQKSYLGTARVFPHFRLRYFRTPVPSGTSVWPTACRHGDRQIPIGGASHDNFQSSQAGDDSPCHRFGDYSTLCARTAGSAARPVSIFRSVFRSVCTGATSDLLRQDRKVEGWLGPERRSEQHYLQAGQ